jgi:hypothetical protein
MNDSPAGVSSCVTELVDSHLVVNLHTFYRPFLFCLAAIQVCETHEVSRPMVRLGFATIGGGPVRA